MNNGKIKNKNHKIVVFDLDETLGCFSQFGIFCDCLDDYFKNNKYSKQNFNKLLDIFKIFLRPKILDILYYLKNKKQIGECKKVMIYTNNQGPKWWVDSIKNYFNYKVKYDLFDKIIYAFKINGQRIEPNRSSHDKKINDFFKCTKLPSNVEICFIDDVYHPGMKDDKVYYINIKPYRINLEIYQMINLFLKSDLAKTIQNTDDFGNFVIDCYNNYNFKTEQFSNDEYEIDKIISKKIFAHLKEFFKDSSKTLKKRIKIKKNKTVRNGKKINM